MVIGICFGIGRERAYYWTTDDGMQDMGVLPGRTQSRAVRVSGDGRFAVGRSGEPMEAAFLWTRESGSMVDLNIYLCTVGMDLRGWTLRTSPYISHDGSAIAGTGQYDGFARAYLISGLDRACLGDVDGNQTVELADLSILLAHFGTSGTQSAGDLTCDGLITLADLAVLLSSFGTTCV